MTKPSCSLASQGGEGINAAIAAGRFGDAATDYFSLPSSATERVLSPEHSLALAEWLRENKHEKAALIVLRRQMRDYPRGPLLAEAHMGAGLIQLEDLGQAASAYQHFLAALDLEPAPAVATLARRGLAAVEALQKRRVGRLR